MKIRVSEADGALLVLDRLVNMAEGLDIVLAPVAYSSDWRHGGPIIEREWIGLDYYPDSGLWHAGTCEGTVWGMGRTPLIAAMRCYVISRFGDVVEIPEGL
jgi:Protein of unknown function (DUF2591)